MAGAGLAAEVAANAEVILIEAESRPGYHSTGRSAAFWSRTYGGPAIEPLTRASEDLLARPPAAFADRPFLSPRGAIHLANAHSRPGLDRLAQDFGALLQPMERAALESRIEGLRPGWDFGLYEQDCRDIDVARLHQAYLSLARRRGAKLLCDRAFRSARREGGRWRAETRGGPIEADLLVNAAGAWADEVAAAAGQRPLGIRPYRRTMIQLRTDPPAAPDLPLIIDAAQSFYFKPEAGGRLWLSPHDEAPCPAGDCAPDTEDVAIALDRLGQAVDWRVERVEKSWAGLRSFAPDRRPVYGFADGQDGFFWCAGQGGFGIQTAPAASRMAASLLLGGDGNIVPGVDPSLYLASRFATGA